MLKEVMLVGGGAFVGANARYGVSLLSARFLDSAWPYGTLVANVCGSLVLGFFFALVSARTMSDPALRLLVAVGFCGSFTTFSSYAYETLRLFEQGEWGAAAANVLANNVLCLIAVLAGMWAARWI